MKVYTVLEFNKLRVICKVNSKSYQTYRKAGYVTIENGYFSSKADAEMYAY